MYQIYRRKHRSKTMDKHMSKRCLYKSYLCHLHIDQMIHIRFLHIHIAGLKYSVLNTENRIELRFMNYHNNLISCSKTDHLYIDKNSRSY